MLKFWVIYHLIKRIEDGERVKPESDEEKLCFQLIKDLDHVGGFVKGSATTKKYMHNKIWSLISFMNTLLELWYNTLDILCTNGHFSSILLISRDRVKIT